MRTLTLFLVASAPYLLHGLSSPPVEAPLEHPAQDLVYYFVLTDRFDDGNSANNANGGYDPTDPAAYHGGDFAGLRNRLDYLAGMGVNALWLTPIFQNQAVQGSSSAYHGYWITDFMNPDAHLGTPGEFEALVSDLHSRDMRIFLDIITNHTADVNRYTGRSESYVLKADQPYLDAEGVPFDDRDYAWNGTGVPSFPELDPAISFPLQPYIPAGMETLRNPMWLNDLTNYHNRGASTFSGENSLYGDFFGLDDLFTEKPEVVQGMIDIYSYWIREYSIDGFRIDTVKHVNREFWEAFAPAVKAAAEDVGTTHFFQFGEVFNFDPAFLSEFSTVIPLDATLDFAMAGEVRAFAYQGVSSANLNYFFSQDDLLTDADSHANARPLFIGNHDIGRAAAYVRADNPGATEAELIDRLELAKAILFFTRGQPVFYYGDEQGFAGAGGSDVYFREDMMPSQTALYKGMDLVGTEATPAQSNFDTSHPLYMSFSEMAELYHAHPTLRRGAHLPRQANSTNVVAVSRIHRSDLIEYLFVACNRDGGSVSVSVPTSQPQGVSFTRIGASKASAAPANLTSDASGRVSLEIEGLQWALYRAGSSLPSENPAPVITLTSVSAGSVQSVQSYSQEGHDFPGRLEIAASTNISDYAEVTFAYSRSDEPQLWHSLGVDSAPPYRVFFRPPESIPPGVTFTFAASINDTRGGVAHTVAPEVLLTRGAPVTSLIIHYQREDGAYDDWGIVAEGPGLANGRYGTSSSPQTFDGMDDFGAFAIVPLEDPAKPLRFSIQKANGSSFPANRAWDGQHTIVPQSTAEIWVEHGDIKLYPSLGEWQGFLDIRYRNSSGANGWNLSIRDPFTDLAPQELAPISVIGTTASFRLEPSLLGLDWGATVEITPMNTNLDTEDSTYLLPLRAAGKVWIKNGVDWPLLTDAGVQNKAIIHYHRPAGDYGNYSTGNYTEFWGLHVWSGAAFPTEWSSPLRPVREDAFGVVFEVPLKAGAQSLSYIIHRGDVKDPGPDQSLPLQSVGNEVWQVQGASTLTPYVRTSGVRGVYGGFLSPAEAIRAAGLSLTPALKLQCYAPMGQSLHLEMSTLPQNGAWIPLVEPFLGTGEQMEFELPSPLGTNQLFRLRTP
jgi:glycosidase